jgi:glycosyltransferase involved in cell wall biosynthesis
MITKKPSAIVYGWYKLGEELLETDIYGEEGLWDEVVVYSLPDPTNVIEDYTKYRPDLIISLKNEVELLHYQLVKIHHHFDEPLNDYELANIIVKECVNKSCEVQRPRFSVFTPVYKTCQRINRTYESLKNQRWTNWEWVVVDDSPDEETWKILVEISKKDYRVKLHRIYPTSGGVVGLAKHRAASFGDGDWLVELDHDDYLSSDCLSTCNDAILRYPDAGFLYSDVAELYDDGEMKHYDHDWTGNWYARHDNYFDFGYAGHSWVKVDGKDILAHWYPDINPLSIRFNISMPNHVRMWERKFYHSIGGHNKTTPVADDFEIIVRSFLNTRIIHVKRCLYLQYNNRNSTVDNNATDINRRARLIRDFYDEAIHNRILELGFKDWNWDEKTKQSQRFQNRVPIRKYFEEEQVMNYIYE